jgi:hypothetical protein
MAFTLQGFGPFLHWLTLVILCVLPVIIGTVLYKIGGLPGSIAATRGHPQAAAINVCGWMGLVTLVLWPIASRQGAGFRGKSYRFPLRQRQAAAGIAAPRSARSRSDQDHRAARRLAMLWAIASSAFVIYLYRKLNAPAGAANVEGATSAIDAELTKLNSRIDALENLISGETRGITP